MNNYIIFLAILVFYVSGKKPDFKIPTTKADCISYRPKIRPDKHYPFATPGVYAFTTVGDGTGTWFFNEKGDIIDCLLAKDIIYSEGVITNASAMEIVTFDTDPRGVEKYEYPLDNQRKKSHMKTHSKEDCYCNTNIVLKVLRATQSASFPGFPWFNIWSELIITDRFDPIARTDLVPSSTFDIASNGRHEGAFELTCPQKQIISSVFDGRQVTYQNLDGTYSNRIIAGPAYQIRSYKGKDIKSYTGWGYGDCDTNLTCLLSLDRPSRYFPYTILQTQQDWPNVGTLLNSVVQTDRRHWIPEDDVDSTLLVEFFGAVISKVLDDGNIAWRFHGNYSGNLNLNTDFPWKILNDDTWGGPSTYHFANVENLDKNNFMGFENGRGVRGDPCHPSLNLKPKDFTNPDNYGLAEECAKPRIARTGCPLTRVVEWNIKTTRDGNVATRVWSYPDNSLLPDDIMLPYNETFQLHPPPIGPYSSFCGPIWDKYGEFASFVSSARRLSYMGSTLIAIQDCRSTWFCNTPVSGMPKGTPIMREVDMDGYLLNKFVVDSTEGTRPPIPSTWVDAAMYRVGYVDNCAFRDGDVEPIARSLPPILPPTHNPKLEK